MRKCIKCGLEKLLHEFRKNGKWFKHTCKECCNAPHRTGKFHEGRFKKGHQPINAFFKGHKTWNKGRKLSLEELKKMQDAYKKRKIKADRGGKGKNSFKYKEWKKLVFERDGSICIKCKSKERLDAHHKVSWREDENLRFDVFNGETLCRSCHMRHEQNERIKNKRATEFKKDSVPWNKGLIGYRCGKRKPHSEETKRKISQTKRLKNALHPCPSD